MVIKNTMTPEETSAIYETKRKYAPQNSLYRALLILYSTHIIRSDSMSLIYDPDARTSILKEVSSIQKCSDTKLDCSTRHF